MSIQALQEFIGRHMVSAGALTAVAAALDAKAGGAPLDPMLAIRIQEFLDTLGASDLLNEIGPQAAATMRSMVRAMYLLDSKLLSCTCEPACGTTSSPRSSSPLARRHGSMPLR
jgi:hypothetical protein